MNLSTSTTVAPRRFKPSESGLTAAMARAFSEDGYLLIEDFVSATACDELRAHASRLVADFDCENHRAVFSTKAPDHVRDGYFQESGDKIRFFLEEEALDEEGRLTRAKEFAFNKIGHAMHDLDPVFSDFSRNPRLKMLAANLFDDPLLLQSMYIFKQPRIGGEVVWHQDSTYLYTEPMSCVGFWFALEDATRENGSMFCKPGAHLGPLRSRLRREDGKLVTRVLDETPWPDIPAVALEATKGSLVVLHGLLPHYSGANRSDRSRHAYTLHMIDGACRYPADNWLRRGPHMPLRGF